MILEVEHLIGALAVLILVLTIDVFCLRRKLRKFLKGDKNEDFGATLRSIHAGVTEIEKFKSEMEKYLVGVEKRLRRSPASIETVRFNAFKGDGLGGNQSFATAIVSEDGDGAVLSSLYTRERVSVFAKPLAKFGSEIELTEEERKAISLAKAKLSHKS
ncbi:MAG: DUF4446 family protein [Candidatus Taylorbacteria bacterium]|nr:DUF4446 family protein [Candidatus Taylorbacteria bacterium]